MSAGAELFGFEYIPPKELTLDVHAVGLVTNETKPPGNVEDRVLLGTCELSREEFDVGKPNQLGVVRTSPEPENEQGLFRAVSLKGFGTSADGGLGTNRLAVNASVGSGIAVG